MRAEDPRSLDSPATPGPSDGSAQRDSLQGTQRELRVFAILALTVKALLVLFISRHAPRSVRRISARTARTAGVDLVAELQCCFARRRYEIFT